ncbi:hypothetical protein [Staphylococcus cohnii]|uniref:hypothetical protein n=1 Tax=Staphylococcus cohnii TaxID=29382 RepID=UPI003CFA2151
MSEYFNSGTIITWLIIGIITVLSIYVLMIYERKKKKLNMSNSLIRAFSVATGIAVFVIGLSIPILVDQIVQFGNDIKSMWK